MNQKSSCSQLSCPFPSLTIWHNLAFIIYAQIVHIQAIWCTREQSEYNQTVKSHQTKWNSMALYRGHCRLLIMLSIYWNFNLNLRERGKETAKWFHSSLPCTSRHLSPMPIFSIQYIQFAKSNSIYFFSIFPRLNSRFFFFVFVYDSYSIYSIPLKHIKIKHLRIGERNIRLLHSLLSAERWAVKFPSKHHPTNFLYDQLHHSFDTRDDTGVWILVCFATSSLCCETLRESRGTEFGEI